MAINCIESKVSPMTVNLVTPDVLCKVVYAAHAAAIPSDIKNDYIFRLDNLMK
jgi:hypothetical protein